MGNRKNDNATRYRRTRRRLIIERLGQRRVLAAITGAVFGDTNHSFQFDSAESGAVARLVYLDTNSNAQLDVDDKYSLTQADGSFSFSGLDDGTYLLRLFSGTDSQIQTFPLEASVSSNTIGVLDAVQLEVIGDTVLALTENSLIIGNLASGAGQTVNVGDQLTEMQALPNGNMLVIGTDVSGDTAWIVNPNLLTATPVALAGSNSPITWSDVAVDTGGGGVILEHSSGNVFAVSIDGSTVNATATSETVTVGSQVLTSNTGVLTVFGVPDESGFDLRLWSNETNSFLSEDPVFASGVSSLLAFDNASGVLAARNQSGGVNIYDAANSFQPLHSLGEIDGPIAIDGARDLLMAISSAEAMLKIMNLRDGDLIAELAIDLSAVGEVAALAMSDRNDSVVVLGAAGVTEIALKQPTAHEIVVSAGLDPDRVLFGLSVDGENSAPAYASPPSFEALEDTLLELASPAALQNAFGSIGEAFVVIQSGQANHGTAIIRVDGSVIYDPNSDFFGSDSVPVQLHDGRSISENFTIGFTVIGTPDEPTGLEISIDPVPENIPIGTSIGEIEVIDADGNEHFIAFSDPRFGHDSGAILFIGGDYRGIDYEQEPFIPVTVSVTDPETETTIEEDIVLTIQDRNDPATAITPTTGFVDENDKGAIVVELDVEDQDGEQAHFLTVDDERFVVVNEVLQLAPGVEVDFETEPTIVINITATEIPGGGTYTEEFTVTVRDKFDTSQILDLTNKTVLEFERGAVVGNVTVEGQAAASNFEFTVDDPRFEVDGSTLKLKDNEYIVRYNQEEILVEVTASNSSGIFAPVSEEFVIEVLVNEKPYHNEAMPYDVDYSGEISAVDALAIINFMGEYGSGPVGNGDPGKGYDVNGDGEVTALDALLIINQLNRENNGTVGGSHGEGEQAPIAPGRRMAQNDDHIDDLGFEASAPATPSQPNPLKIVGVNSLQSSSRPADPIEIAAERSARSFAESVDVTLRLLSDDDA